MRHENMTALWATLPFADQQVVQMISEHARLDGSPAASENAHAKTPGLRGALYGRLKTVIKEWVPNADDLSNDLSIDILIEIAFGIRGGSTKEMTIAEVNAMLWALNDELFHPALKALLEHAPAALDKLYAAETQAATQALEGALAEPEETKGAIPVTDQAQHWAADEAVRIEFAKWYEGLGLSATEAQSILGIERLGQYTGTYEDARKAISAHLSTEVERVQNLAPVQTSQEHREARVVAWCRVFTPDGVDVSVTARQGTTVEEIVGTTMSLHLALQQLAKVGFTHQITVPIQRANGKGAPPPQEKTMPPRRVEDDDEPATTPAPVQAPPPPASAPAAAPAPAQPAPTAQAPASGQDVARTFVVDKIIVATTSSGGPRVDFYGVGRKWADTSWAAGVDTLFGRFPALTEHGWTAQHFVAGKTYAGIKGMKVSIEPSQKLKASGRPYMNIVAIEIG